MSILEKKTNRQKHKPAELEKIIKYLTNEDFEDYTGKQFKRRLINPDNFEIVDTYPKPSDLVDSGDETDKFTCICSENTCNHLIIIWHKPTNTYMAVGSTCYTRFNEENSVDIYYHCNSKKCDGCKIPLVFKENIQRIPIKNVMVNVLIAFKKSKWKRQEKKAVVSI